MSKKLKNILWVIIGTMLLGTGIYAGSGQKMSFEEAQQKKESRQKMKASGNKYQAMTKEQWKNMSAEEKHKYSAQMMRAEAKEEASENLRLLKEIFKKGKFHPSDSQIIIRLSGAKEKRAVPILIKILKGEYITGIRISAAEALGNIGDISAYDDLKKASGDKDIQIQLEAAIALYRLGHIEEAFSVLAKVVKRQNADQWNLDVTAHIEYSDYSEIEKEKKTQELIERFKNKSLPSKAIRYLGKIGSEQALNVIEKTLSDPNEFVRLRAGSVLMETERKNVTIPILEKIVANDSISRSVRSAALSALAKGKGKKEKAILEKYKKSSNEYLSKKAKKLIEKIENR